MSEAIDRRADREGLGQDHPEALAAQRGRDQHVGGREHLGPVGVVDGPERGHAALIDQHRRELLRRDADQLEARRDPLAQRLERAQRDRQALALDGLADERDAQRALHARQRRRLALEALGQRHAVGDHAVAPAEEALARPRRRRRDGDPHAQPLKAPRRAEEVAEAVGEAVGRVGVKGPDERRAASRSSASQLISGHDRLVDVDDVVAAARAAPRAEPQDRQRRDRDVGDRAVGGQADRAPERRRRSPRARAAAGQTPRCRRALRRSCGSDGVRIRTSCPSRSSSPPSASMWRVTPPGYVHEYGETSAIRISGEILPAACAAVYSCRMVAAARCRFLAPAWRARRA